MQNTNTPNFEGSVTVENLFPDFEIDITENAETLAAKIAYISELITLINIFVFITNFKPINYTLTNTSRTFYNTQNEPIYTFILPYINQ